MQCETFNTQYFQQRSTSINSKKRLEETHSLNKHMTWTNDPKPDPKENLQVILTDTNAITSVFRITVWPPHASSFPGVHLRFRL